jgi:hypothetical protein
MPLLNIKESSMIPKGYMEKSFGKTYLHVIGDMDVGAIFVLKELVI